ncbi:MAG: PocR ligand-binding domain-containing protein, partial [Pyrinomonadaceae bacterium]
MENESNNILDEIADASGLAVVVLDEAGSELSASNNNSICSMFYSSAEFGPKCAEFCGKALSRSFEAGETIEYSCHAGLYCKATPLESGEKRLVAILGRIYTKADNYRQITERAINGDLQQFAPDKLFENVLIAGSDDSFKDATEKLNDLSSL